MKEDSLDQKQYYETKVSVTQNLLMKLRKEFETSEFIS